MMEIDNQTEPLVREALAAVVGKDPDRLQRAILAFPDSDTMAKGIRLATAVSLYILHDQYGHTPTEAEIRAAATGVADLESWTDVTADEVVAALTAAINRVRADQVLPVERVVILAFVIAANLVSSCHKDDEEWWDYLDRAEAVIQATPAS
jgi:antirestriction protein ArdC